MRRVVSTIMVLGMCASASAAPNVTNVTQKGSLLVFPDIRIDEGWNTLVRIQNDGSLDVDVKCMWMDGNKNRTDFIVPVTRNQPIWFDARTGNGTWQVNTFPRTPANGFDNPFLAGQPAPVNVTVAAFGDTRTHGSFTAPATGPVSVVPQNDFVVVQQGTLTWEDSGGTPDAFATTPITQAVTINGVTQNVTFDLSTAFGVTDTDSAFAEISNGVEVIFSLPDGRQIAYRTFGFTAFSEDVNDSPMTVDIQVELRLLNPEAGDTAGPTERGMLACWAVDGGAQQQVKWNHLSGTATVHNERRGGYEYNAYAFFVPTGLDLEPVGLAGTLNLNGVEYDSCPLYQIGQFSPRFTQLRESLFLGETRLAITGCTMDFRQDWLPIYTKLQFDVWNEDETKFTGAFECADTWHETLFDEDFDSAVQNFDADTLGTYTARYRVQGVKSTQCETSSRTTQAVGVLGVQSTLLCFAGEGCSDRFAIGTTLTNAGKFNGAVLWDPEGAVPEGGIR